MPNLKRPELAAEARRRSQEQFARVGGELRVSRKRRRLTQEQLGARVGLSQSAVSLAERGHGGSLSMDTWQRVFTAVDRRLLVDVSRDAVEEPIGAGHLAIQELLLREGRRGGQGGTFELPTRPADSRHSVDVALRNDRLRVLLLLEAWNSFGDIGAAARSTEEGGGGGSPRRRGRRRTSLPRRQLLGGQSNGEESRARSPLSGAVRQAVPGLVRGLGEGHHPGRATSRASGPRLVRCRRDPVIRVAAERGLVVSVARARRQALRTNICRCVGERLPTP